MPEYLEPLLATPCIWSFAASPVGGRAPIIFLGWPSVFVRPLVRCEIKHQPKQINKPTTMLQNSIRFFVRSTSGVPVTNGSEKTRPTLFLKPSHCRRIRQIIRSRKQQENGREAILIHCNYCITFILDLIPLTCRTQKRRSSYNQSTCSFKSFGFWLKKKEVLLSPFNQPKKTYNIINCSQIHKRSQGIPTTLHPSHSGLMGLESEALRGLREMELRRRLRVFLIGFRTDSSFIESSCGNLRNNQQYPWNIHQFVTQQWPPLVVF